MAKFFEPSERPQAVVIAAAAAMHALLSNTAQASLSPQATVQMAFEMAEAFIAEAEKRVAGG